MVDRELADAASTASARQHVLLERQQQMQPTVDMAVGVLDEFARKALSRQVQHAR